MTAQTETIRIDAARALALLHEVVDAAAPGYTYTPRKNPETNASACVYVRDGAPSCLVGRALALAGLPLDDLARMDEGVPEEYEDGEPLGYANPESAFEVLYEHGGLPDALDVTEEAARILQSVQQQQDEGTPWGEALRRTEAGEV